MDAARTQDTVRMQPNEETTHKWHGQDSPCRLGHSHFSQSLENRNLKKKENKRTEQLVDGGVRVMDMGGGRKKRANQHPMRHQSNRKV